MHTLGLSTYQQTPCLLVMSGTFAKLILMKMGLGKWQTKFHRVPWKAKMLLPLPGTDTLLFIYFLFFYFLLTLQHKKNLSYHNWCDEGHHIQKGESWRPEQKGTKCEVEHIFVMCHLCKFSKIFLPGVHQDHASCQIHKGFWHWRLGTFDPCL